MFSQGVSRKDIAKQIGISYAAVARTVNIEESANIKKEPATAATVTSPSEIKPKDIISQVSENVNCGIIEQHYLTSDELEDIKDKVCDGDDMPPVTVTCETDIDEYNAAWERYYQKHPEFRPVEAEKPKYYFSADVLQATYEAIVIKAEEVVLLKDRIAERVEELKRISDECDYRQSELDRLYQDYEKMSEGV